MVFFFFFKCMEAKEKGLFHCITIFFSLCSCVKPKLDLCVALKASHSLRFYFKYHSYWVLFLLFYFVSKLSYLRLDLTDVVYKKDTWQLKLIHNFFHSCRESSHCGGNTKKENNKKTRGAEDCWQIKNRKKMQMWGLALVYKPQIIFQVGAMCKECLIVLPHPTSLCCLI